MSIKGKACIAGIYEHPTRKAPDKSVAQLHAECARGALADAGLGIDDVDGYFCAGDAPGLGPLSMIDYRHPGASSMSQQRTIPAPAVNPESRRFWDACRQQRLLIGRDNTTGEHFYYPRGISPLSGSDDVDWVEASGEGVIYSFSIMRRADPIYAIAYVTLAEGPTIMSNIVDCDLERIRIGDSVRAVFKDSDGGQPVPCFTPAG